MEATIRIYSQAGIIERTMTLSEHPGMRRYVFESINPNLIFQHGEHADAPVIIWQAGEYRTVEQGSHLPFSIGERIIDVDHKAPVEPF